MTGLPRVRYIDRAGRAQDMDAQKAQFPVRIRKSLHQEQTVRKQLFSAWLMLATILAMPGLAWPQTGQQNSTLILMGHPGQATVVQMNGRSYVDLESLARLVNGSISFGGNQITLTRPASVASATTASPANQPANPGFSKEFMRAGIETMSDIREWRSVIVNIVQHSYPFDETAFAAYSAAAARNLNLASVAASTDSDRSAFQLLSNEMNNMQMLSSQILENRRTMYYMPPNYLDDNSLNQKILSCARSLASMAASGQFADDGSCH
jgi:hypothetical protein